MNDRKELLAAVKKAYQKGYGEGFTDACDLLQNALSDLRTSVQETLDEHIIAVDEKDFI